MCYLLKRKKKKLFVNMSPSPPPAASESSKDHFCQHKKGRNAIKTCPWLGPWGLVSFSEMMSSELGPFQVQL